jgi:hypothetical protein
VDIPTNAATMGMVAYSIGFDFMADDSFCMMDCGLFGSDCDCIGFVAALALALALVKECCFCGKDFMERIL